MSDESEHDRSLYEPSTARMVERHFQTMVLVLMTGVMGWLGWTVQDLNVKTATLTEKLVQIQDRQTYDREQLYTAKDAFKDFQLRDSTLANIATRVLALEQDTRK